MTSDETNDMQVRPVRDGDMAAIVELSLLAWEPVFASFAQVMGPVIFARQYPDWRAGQRAVVEEYCAEGTEHVAWLAEVEGEIAGFVVYDLNVKDRIGEIQLLAVHPEHQSRGIGTELTTFALGKLKDAGMTLAAVGTGGDPSHAPARRSYEKAGFTALPLVRYYKALDGDNEGERDA